MHILGISGSSTEKSSNYSLLNALKELSEALGHSFLIVDDLGRFPLFTTKRLADGVSEDVKTFQKEIAKADYVVITTPEYIHNIPAVLKNAMEWVTASGELKEKKVLALTLTPHEPRGKYAMEALLTSLKALEARVVGSLSLYKNEFKIEEEKVFLSDEYKVMFKEAFQL